MKSLFKSERGAAFVETAVTFPLVLGFMFLVYDAMVIGFDWLSLHRVAQQTMREAAVGVKDNEGETDYLSRATNRGEVEFRKAFGLSDTKTMASGMAQLCDTAGYDCTSNPINVQVWNSPTDDDSYVQVRVHKKLFLSPAGKLLSRVIASQHDEVNLTVTSIGRVEKIAS